MGLAARSLGVREVGIERDPNPCATRRAAGLATVEDDVRRLSPADFPSARILASSPPCQTFAIAGHGAGRSALHGVLRLVRCMGDREDVAGSLADLGDERTGLVLEPLRWALAAVDSGRPYDAIILEQVPPVLPIWQAVGKALSGEGYSVACGIAHAEEFGVPQTRRRAILVARRDGAAALPHATHRPYRKASPRPVGDPSLPPCKTMSDTLGRPDPFIVVSDHGAGGDPRARGRRTSSEPAFTITSKIARSRVMTTDGTPLPRLTSTEAGQLQSFPRAHPWAGKNIAQQIGNAMPPLLATHVLAAAMSSPKACTTNPPPQPTPPGH
ncbi:DNA cytosine methyltransferase [Streptomyces sp. MT29]|nr:DNA cytosine methyltransferase [Streptomyces sp. MT29]